jgi:hypothetical protein
MFLSPKFITLLRPWLCAFVLLLLTGTDRAQTTASGQTAPSPASTAAEPRWEQLSAIEQQLLQPLEPIWSSLSQGHRRKWLAIAKNYPGMSDADREKLQSRMAEWATLKPKEREQARLNFAQTKKLPPDARAATWEAYQALTEQERRALLDTAPKKPSGAAIAAKPVAPSKLAEVPVTRKTSEPVKASSNARPAIDRYTLLPFKDTAVSN